MVRELSETRELLTVRDKAAAELEARLRSTAADTTKFDRLIKERDAQLDRLQRKHEY